MSARTTLRWVSAVFLVLGLLGLLGRFIDLNWEVTLAAPLTFVVIGFVGVLALFFKD